MSTRSAAIQLLTWEGCYDDGWRDLIVPEAFAHPAKFARGLVERIVRHGLAEGWWCKGETIGDPFGGIATGGDRVRVSRAELGRRRA